MRFTLWLAIPFIVMTSCATAPQNEPAPQRRQQPRGGGGMQARGPARGEGDSFLPPQSWWRDPQLAEPVGLSNEQFERLDKLQTEAGVEVWRSSDEVSAATRAFREALSARDANPNSIREAAARLRDARTAQFDRQIAMLVGEREILTNDQWTRLEATLAAEMTQRRSREGQRGGQGGMGGGRGGQRGGGRGGRYP